MGVDDGESSGSTQSRSDEWIRSWRGRSRALQIGGVVVALVSFFGAGVLLSETESVVVRIIACASVPFCLVGAGGLIVMSMLCPGFGAVGPEDVQSRLARGTPVRFSLDPEARGAHIAFLPVATIGWGLFVAGIGGVKAEAAGFDLGSVSLLVLGAAGVLASIASVWRYVGEYSIVLNADGLALTLGRGYQGHIAWDDIRDAVPGRHGRYPLVLHLRQGTQFENTSPHWENRLGGGLIERTPFGDGCVILEAAGWTSPAGSLPEVLAAYLDGRGEASESIA